MGNCSQRAVSDGGGSVTVIATDSRNIMEEYYRSRRCSSLPITREKTLGYLVRQGTTSPRGVLGPKIQVSPQRRNGVWKAKVVIGSKQLEEILAVEGNTHALIDQLRFAAAEALVSSTSASEMVRVKSLSSRPRKNNENYFC
ncbi:hypothetical protein ISN45_Aa06g032890 [Arabidopsis thaliana x Arabidopsis arenosa]|uniref:Uncharacterized protein n=1 Tax=Arabidopsis thaliana x Arabidopsis arenosa TaxID=1240361 RepID=A0A8T1Z368_9BRAS|nr:hypothetical protein ISN45_Aa06g032890 [Arabidopsis thaliana x Arabidopsis arenosa]